MQSNSHFRWTVDKAWLNSVDYWETLLIMIKMSCGQFQRHYLEENTCKIAGSAHESRTGDNIKKKKKKSESAYAAKAFVLTLHQPCIPAGFTVWRSMSMKSVCEANNDCQNNTDW